MAALKDALITSMGVNSNGDVVLVHARLTATSEMVKIELSPTKRGDVVVACKKKGFRLKVEPKER